MPISQVESVQHGCGRWCRYSATTSRYSLSRLRTRMSHLHFTIYYLILHLVQYFFSLKNVNRLSSRKGITTGDNAQRSRGDQQQQPGNICQGCLPSAPAPAGLAMAGHGNSHLEIGSLKEPSGNIHVQGQFEMSSTTLF